MIMSVNVSGHPVKDELITSKEIRQTLGGISSMTLWRWLNDPAYTRLNFPRPIIIRNRHYWKQSDILKFITEQSSEVAA